MPRYLQLRSVAVLRAAKRKLMEKVMRSREIGVLSGRKSQVQTGFLEYSCSACQRTNKDFSLPGSMSHKAWALIKSQRTWWLLHRRPGKQGPSGLPRMTREVSELWRISSLRSRVLLQMTGVNRAWPWRPLREACTAGNRLLLREQSGLGFTF